MSVCVRLWIRGIYQFELRKERGEIWPAGRVLCLVVGGGDVVFHCSGQLRLWLSPDVHRLAFVARHDGGRVAYELQIATSAGGAHRLNI